MSVALQELVRWLDDYLRVADFPDKSLNGLQVDGPDTVSRVALATDAALQTFEAAAAGGAQLLLVHHGLIWGSEPRAVTGAYRRRIQALLDAGVALYGSHLPLDAHPDVGNNAVLARRLELRDSRPFGAWEGVALGTGGELPRPMARDELRAWCEERLEAAVRLLPFGPEICRRVALVSGAAADLAVEAAREGYDAFLTGETSHTAYHHAREAAVNVLFGGHYATETWGVRALGECLERRWGLEVFFCDVPTGF